MRHNPPPPQLIPTPPPPGIVTLVVSQRGGAPPPPRCPPPTTTPVPPPLSLLPPGGRRGRPPPPVDIRPMLRAIEPSWVPPIPTVCLPPLPTTIKAPHGAYDSVRPITVEKRPSGSGDYVSLAYRSIDQGERFSETSATPKMEPTHEDAGRSELRGRPEKVRRIEIIPGELPSIGERIIHPPREKLGDPELLGAAPPLPSSGPRRIQIARARSRQNSEALALPGTADLGKIKHDGPPVLLKVVTPAAPLLPQVIPEVLPAPRPAFLNETQKEQVFKSELERMGSDNAEVCDTELPKPPPAAPSKASNLDTSAQTDETEPIQPDILQESVQPECSALPSTLDVGMEEEEVKEGESVVEDVVMSDAANEDKEEVKRPPDPVVDSDWWDFTRPYTMEDLRTKRSLRALVYGTSRLIVVLGLACQLSVATILTALQLQHRALRIFCFVGMDRRCMGAACLSLAWKDREDSEGVRSANKIRDLVRAVVSLSFAGFASPDLQRVASRTLAEITCRDGGHELSRMKERVRLYEALLVRALSFRISDPDLPLFPGLIAVSTINLVDGESLLQKKAKRNLKFSDSLTVFDQLQSLAIGIVMDFAHWPLILVYPLPRIMQAAVFKAAIMLKVKLRLVNDIFRTERAPGHGLHEPSDYRRKAPEGDFRGAKASGESDPMKSKIGGESESPCAGSATVPDELIALKGSKVQDLIDSPYGYDRFLGLLEDMRVAYDWIEEVVSRSSATDGG